MSIGKILNTARSSILTHQTATQTVAHNIANAHTPGYSRQIASLSTAAPVRLADGWVGSGVGVSDITRQRDSFMDAAFRRESTSFAGFDLKQSQLQQVESIFGEPSPTGFGSTLDAFYSSWSDLANQPESASMRLLVQQRGEQVAYSMRSMSEQLTAHERSIAGRLEGAAAAINQHTASIAELNAKIAAAERTGAAANDLRDARDGVIDALAEWAPVRVIERDDGMLGVYIAGATVVDGTQSRDVALLTDGDAPVQLSIADRPLALGSGKAAALLDMANTEIPAIRAAMDDIAAAIVSQVNELHLSGSSGVAFFDPAAVSAADIRLSAAVASDPSQISAGYDPAAPGDNRLALDLAALRTESSEGDTVAGRYRTLVASLGAKTAAAGNSAEVFGTLAGQMDARRASISGVSVDEEMVHLMSHQQAFMAASRVINAADEMAQTILQMV